MRAVKIPIFLFSAKRIINTNVGKENIQNKRRKTDHEVIVILL
jgi:hypothetical protein